jgi:DNA-directed RNA polymerase specialized sigma24 family protein
MSASMRELLSSEVPNLHALAYHMSGERAEAKRIVIEVVRRARERSEEIVGAADPARALLGVMARDLEENLNRRSEHTFDSLDQLLRSDITRPIDLRTAGMGEDPTKVHLMLWELKRTCLTSVLCCLPPGVRLSFVLTDLAGLSPAEAAELLGIKESAYRVRLTRARKRIEDYLAPRCYHVDRQNPCTCPGRLMIAVDADFVSQPPHDGDIPHEPHDAGGPRRDVGSLYRTLPATRLNDADFAALVGD